MKIFPTSNLKRRLFVYGALVACVYLFFWYCCRAFNLGQAGKPAGDVAALETRLRRDLGELADGIGERNLFVPKALEQAAVWIETKWKEQGLAPVSYPYQTTLDDPDYRNYTKGMTFRNLEVDVAGPKDAPLVIVGAHYDTVSCAGADDNGSGVVALLELTRQLKGANLKKRLRCVAFTNEEPPFFDTADMGSLKYAQMAKARGDKIELMVSLETIAYYTQEPGSQRYPFGLGHFYPDRGNFIGVVGNIESRPLVERAGGYLKSACDVPVECASLPGRLPGVFWSDHESFWAIGVPAVMITDTAHFRNPHYHRATDKPGTLDFPALSRLTAGIVSMVRELSN